MNGADRSFADTWQSPAGTPGSVGSRGAGAQEGGTSSASPPAISLPKGGGAIRGIGEKFSANPVTGTGSLSVPIYTSPGRSGFGPQLSLSYDSGAGNGPFGLGWSLSIPSITRKTDKGLPEYRDADESDVFILSGAEDLVPVLVKDDEGNWQRDPVSPRTVGGVKYHIERYRPRIEGLFARIERWTNQRGETHWRSISKDNVSTLYGKTEESRIFDPEDPTRVFSWLICESYDDKGNASSYEYKAENSQGVDLSLVQERNRTATTRAVNRYLKRIKYGNRTPRQPGEDLSKRTDWTFEAVFDYGEHYTENTQGQPTSVFIDDDQRQWKVRRDPFSTYRAGFEVRTYRLCRRVLMFHHFPDELGTDDYLVRSTEFAYDESPIASFTTGITQPGYVRKSGGTYLKKSLPPLEFEYGKATIRDEVREIDAESLENLPSGLDGTRYQWLDLDGEGASGILTEQAGAWFYKRNLSPVSVESRDGQETVVARFAPSELVGQKPSLAEDNGGREQFLDLAGDGSLDLVQFDDPVPGFYEHTDDARWEKFASFTSLPELDWSDPNLRFVDLTGDGHTDVLITEDDAFTWYPSLAEAGFGGGERVRLFHDEEKGPRLVFADGTQSVYLADISGDGLIDLVRIRNGEVCYWPNVGYGRFGPKVTMDDSPWFDSPDQFDQRRIRLADIDGSGVTDILYLGRDGAHLYFNQSGNSWSGARTLPPFPHTDDLSSVEAADLLGNGTACLIWSSPLPGDARRPMRYIDLMGGQKPHLLVKVVNNLGAETRVRYATSTRFYLEDRAAGRPWITKLPFPVHVVERVETYDRISRNRFVVRYAYHHGCFDGPEREFRGFGMVEQWDTEEIGTVPLEETSSETTNLDAASHVPPVLTRSWFHTGAYLQGERISRQLAHEYYGAPEEGDPAFEAFKAALLPDTILPTGLTMDEEREACRALKGSILRQETYALDGSPQSEHPYSVSERNYTIECLQPQETGRHAVFFVHPREMIDHHCERDPSDPRVTHELTLAVDAFGNVLESAAIGYGRRQNVPGLSGQDQAKQTRTLITCTENRFTNPINLEDDYRAPLACESRSYELTGTTPGASGRFDFATMDDAVTNATPLAYEATPSGGLQKRLIEHARTLYRENDLTGPLPLGQLASLALPFESYKLAFTPGLVTQVYGNRVTDAMLTNQGRYVHSEGDGNWWIPSGRVFYSPNSGDTPTQELAFARQHFFLSRRFRNPFGQTTTVRHDDHDLLLLESEDPLHNKITAGERGQQGKITNKNDYRVLQPSFVTDPNGNRSAVAFDALGLAVGTAVMGKVGQNVGDSLGSFELDLDEPTLIAHVNAPLDNPHSILGRATTRLLYDLHRYRRTSGTTNPQPNGVCTLARETHDANLVAGEKSEIQQSLSYSDGFGREVQKKIQAEPGDVDGVATNPRWVGSGWTIFNNKGKPVKRYEPFFSSTHLFEFKISGVSSTLFYDPLERVVATLHPNHTYEKLVFDPWRQETWDANDTVLRSDPKTDPRVGDFFRRLPATEYLPTWHESRKSGQLGTAEKAAAMKAAAHASTPTIACFDTLGRPFLTIADNGAGGKYPTRVELDIEGNQRAVIDARGRTVVRYDYDMLGSRIKQSSMEAGTRWTLNDAAGKSIFAWDSRNHTIRTTYDALQRPAEVFLRNGTGAELLVGRTVYGEAQGSALNHRGRIYQQFDGAGVLTNQEFDFKSNLLRSSRRLAANYKDPLNWSAAVALEAKTFTTSITYDALNRPVTQILPDNSLIRAHYNEANLLEGVEIRLRGAAVATTFVKDIDYNARGQREFVEYGNSTFTEYAYDKDTFRLVHLNTTRPTFPAAEQVVQDLSYTYDPVGNITRIEDDADTQNAVFFKNRRVEPSADYTYDALYRLIEATGREHLGQTAGGALRPPAPTSPTDAPRVSLAHPGDGNAMGGYTEKYEYNQVGNIAKLIHTASSGGWTRNYAYDGQSLLEPTKKNNRLTSTTVGAATGTYAYDAHGNMTRMPHLPLMRWDYRDQLQATAQQVIHNGTPETTYYVYDAAGQRVRKVTERSVTAQQAAAGKKPTRKAERIYLGGFEIYREYGGDGSTVSLERDTLHAIDDKQRIALVEIRTQGNDGSPAQLIRYHFGNHLNSASLELDAQASVVSYEEYYPYGSTSYQAVRSQTQTPKRYRYTTKERDEESGLYYHGTRYYASWLGRWVSCDPAGLVDGINVYAYARANPIKLVDPNGRQSDAPRLLNLTPSPQEEHRGFLDRPLQEPPKTLESLYPTPLKGYLSSSFSNQSTEYSFGSEARSSVNLSSNTKLSDWLSLTSETQLSPTGTLRTPWRLTTDQYRIDRTTGILLSGDLSLKITLPQTGSILLDTTIPASLEASWTETYSGSPFRDLERQRVGAYKLTLGPFSGKYSNDHCFPWFPMGGCTDQGNTMALELAYKLDLQIGNFPIGNNQYQRFILNDWTLESVGLNLRLGTGIPPRVPSDDKIMKFLGATPGEPDLSQSVGGFYTNVKYPEAFQGSLSVAATFRDPSGNFSVTTEAGWNSGLIKGFFQGQLVHRSLGIPEFREPPISEPYLRLGVTQRF